MNWIGWMGALICTAILLGLSYLRVHIFYARAKDNDRLFVEFKVLGGIIRYRYEVPLIEYRNLWEGFFIKADSVAANQEGARQENRRFTLERIQKLARLSKNLTSHVDDFTGWLKQTVSYVKCTDFRWNTKVGIEDAAQTALLAGIIWSMKSTFFGFIFHYVELKAKPELSVQPQYNFTAFSTELSLRTKIRLGLLFLVFLKLFMRILKVKGGMKTWQGILFKAS